jgi:ligand-binding sensor domain-containing protein
LRRFVGVTFDGRLMPRLVSLVAGALTVAAPAWALDPDKSITQLVHTAWTAKEGAPTDVSALAQTTDGYLWLGTTSGLFRFDGIRFVRFQPRGDEALPGLRIHRLLATRDGALWISSGIGAWSRLFDGHLSKPENLPPTYDLVVCPDGSLLAATMNGLALLKDGTWKDVGKEWHFPGKQARGAYFDRAGTLWVATEDRMVYRPAGQSGFVDPGDLVKLVLNFAQAPDGATWVAEDMRFAHTVRRIDDRAPTTEVQVGARCIVCPEREMPLEATTHVDLRGPDDSAPTEQAQGQHCRL